ncbi:hypothetical protein Q0N35_09145 [Priestia koreensis]
MNLDEIWKIFFQHLHTSSHILQYEQKNFAGIPFLYIDADMNTTKKEIDEAILASSIRAASHQKVTWRTSFVRNDGSRYVYQHRFIVPLQKMFCCGNNCADCVRYERT